MSVSIDTIRNIGGSRGLRLAALVVMAALAGSEWVGAQEPPVASFEAAKDSPAAASKPGQGNDDAVPPEPTLSFSFRFAPWETVLTKFSDVAGLTLDLSEVPSGTFNYYDKGLYSPREVLDILNGYLLQRGFVLIRRDRFLVCVNLEKGIPANLIPLVTADQLAELGKNDLVSVILSHEDMDAALAASQIAQLQGPHGKVVSLNATNSLLVTDTGGNLRLFTRLLDQGAFRVRASAVTGTAFKSFTLEHVRADEAERLIRTLLGLPPADSSAKDAAIASAPPRPADASITSDARTNRLFVTATSAKLASIEQIVTAYDVAEATTDVSPRRRTPTTRIVPLPNADVIMIGRALESLSPRIRVSTTRSERGGTTAAAAPESDTADKARDTAEKGDAPAAGRPPAEAPQSPDGRDR